VRVLTDGEDDSRVPAERAIPEMLRDFPEVDARTIKATWFCAEIGVPA